jgi:hypothetical protein
LIGVQGHDPPSYYYSLVPSLPDLFNDIVHACVEKIGGPGAMRVQKIGPGSLGTRLPSSLLKLYSHIILYILIILYYYSGITQFKTVYTHDNIYW